ncbi:MAG: acyl-[acyl-carrier-protein]--UDP-N-acetylglucosamine O-acyltransferase [Gammaproteobacteria bacterium RIFCSPHIGHO2_12_FULL_45_9]|nr:MAG: acyl-[acyl-carrier-protein]--UDP-N-acetylglucosamine O-acyltransferase [Gammaproteobacteria bacterium RIFCSPHIGHO2_12_FULL_45_9]
MVAEPSVRHATASIHPSARIAEDVQIGPWCVIGENVEIGAGTILGSHVVIERNTKLGCHNRISQFASLGGDPQHIGYHGEETWLEIGDYNIIRECATINRGTLEGDGVTRVGHHNYFMAYTHVAHDCIVHDHVIFINNASIAGHVEVADYATLSAFSGAHQYVRIGEYSFLGRAALVIQDVLPYMLVTGTPGEPVAVNVVGLKRHGFSLETVRILRRVHQLVTERSRSLEELLVLLRDLEKTTPEVGLVIRAFEISKRGVSR